VRGGLPIRTRTTAVSRALGLLGAGAVIASFACGDPYQRTNPYDPAVGVRITVQGPDTLFSSFQQGTYSAATDPVFPDSAIHWPCCGVSSGRSATYVSVAPPLWPQTRTDIVQAVIGGIDTVPASAGSTLGPVTPVRRYRHTGTKSVVVTQRLVRIQLRCPDAHACDTLSVGATWSVWVDGFDALGLQIYALVSTTANPATGTPIATFAARDTTIASVSPVGIRAVSVTARKSGTTWIVATRDVLLDSLKLVVR
jgi:hypothetical protein